MSFTDFKTTSTMAELRNLKDLLAHEVRLLYSAETLLLVEIPEIILKACNEELKAILDMHWKETGMQVKRLEQVAEYLDMSADGNDNASMQALLAEGEALVDQGAAAPLLDIALTMRMQKIEHYEMAAYNQAVHFAEVQSLAEVAHLLRETLAEERNTSSVLTHIVRNNIMQHAARL